MTIARSRQISLADTPYYHVARKLGHPPNPSFDNSRLLHFS